jgi:preprotein translocase subunit SecA
LNEYKAEAFAMFQDMLDRLREAVTMTLSIVEIDPNQGTLNLMPRANLDQIETNNPGSSTDQKTIRKRNPMASVTPIKREFDKNDPTTWGRVSRNAECPCGSGKKYKHCHGAVSVNG